MKADFSPLEFHVTPEAAGQRLDRFLVSQMPEISRARVQRMLDQDCILVDGRPAKASYKLRGGESILAQSELAPPPLRAMPEAIPLNVVYEDDDLAVIDKPAGMMVHMGAGATEDARNRGTLVNALLHRFASLSSRGGELRPGIVHRLDKLTSGLIIVAKNDYAHQRLAAMFSQRKVKKTYIALVHGRVQRSSGTINAPVGRDAVRRTRMTTRNPANARSAVTHYEVAGRLSTAYGEFTLLSVSIETGRTHQIRVHLSSMGHPIAGDTLYGAPAQITASSKQKSAPSTPLSLERNFLHAAELDFLHPRTLEELSLRSELPGELRAFLASLGQAQ